MSHKSGAFLTMRFRVRQRGGLQASATDRLCDLDKVTLLSFSFLSRGLGLTLPILQNFLENLEITSVNSLAHVFFKCL